MKIEINCSQELLEKSKYCGTFPDGYVTNVSSNCWIALAVREVFPSATVGETSVSIWFEKGRDTFCLRLKLPRLARKMVKCFDSCRKKVLPKETAELRLEHLKPFTFEIELTEEQENILLENISLPDLTECFAKSRHLTLMA